MGYLVPTPSLQKESNGIIKTVAEGDKEVHTFHKVLVKKSECNGTTGVWTHLIQCHTWANPPQGLSQRTI